MCKSTNLYEKRNLPKDKPKEELRVQLDIVQKIMGEYFKLYIESRKDIYESIG